MAPHPPYVYFSHALDVELNVYTYMSAAQDIPVLLVVSGGRSHQLGVVIFLETTNCTRPVRRMTTSFMFLFSVSCMY